MTSVHVGPKLLALLVLGLLLIPASAAAYRPLPLGETDWSVVDPDMAGMLGSAGPDDRVEAVVQFQDGPLPEDRDVLGGLGIENRYEYSILPAVWVEGTAASLERLAGYGRVTWMEHNEQLEYTMEKTTSVINATRAWYSTVEGSLWGDVGFDGKGVTVVVLDSGIDAGHPDLDYGTKTIRNLKSDTGTGPWYEIENGDTSSGHGTHVAGTVAGNGDASAGARPGVAPGANMIGLSAGETLFITGGLGGLEWVYEHSKPGNNPYNIRVCTNSWGGSGGQYDPEDSISQAINRLVYENNVVVTFAAGNSGGTGDTIQASNYGNTPAAICVAASNREGVGITSFSSRGMWNWVDTWPDVAAPGLNVQSTAARRTILSLLERGPTANPYYMPMSGTSMATPHVAGVAAILLEAAPSLRVSELPQDVGVVVEDDGGYSVMPPEEGTYGELAYGYDDWAEAPDTRIHEVELILKLTANPIPPEGEGNPDAHWLTENYVPTWSVPGNAADRWHDFAQGYGLVDVHRAVGLALTLERIRWDEPDATVLDAYTVFEDIFETKEVTSETDRLIAGWSGEWTRFNEQGNKEIFSANLTKYVSLPGGADEVTVSMVYSPLDTTDLTAGSLGFLIDFGADGSVEFDSGIRPSLDGTRTHTIPVSGSDGEEWRFEVYGRVLKVPRPTKQSQFDEARMEFDMSVEVLFESGFGTILVPTRDLGTYHAPLRFGPPSLDYTSGNVSIVTDVYNIKNIQWSPAPPLPPIVDESGGPWLWWLLLLIVVFIVALYVLSRFFPETRAGRFALRLCTAVGLVAVYSALKARTFRVFGAVSGTSKRPKVIKAELVEEGDGTGEG